MPENRAIDPCADECIPQIDQVQFGELYDMINSKVRFDLQDDYDCKKINGATYADTWSKMMGPAIGHIMGGLVSLRNKETAADRCVKEAQCAVYAQDILNKQATASLTVRQEEGFDDNARQKLYEAQMNAWALMFSSGLLEDMPDHITGGAAERIQQDIENAINGSVGDPLGMFTIDLSATAVSGGSTTITWGTVAGASIYTLYVKNNEGSLPGYPKSVTASGTDTATIVTPEANTSVMYNMKIVALDATGKFYRESAFSLTVYGPTT